MLDCFVVVHRGGRQVYCRTFDEVKGRPVNALVQKVILEERSGLDSFDAGVYTLRWTFSNELDLIFVAVYQNALHMHLTYVESLLLRCKEVFCRQYADRLRDTSTLHTFGEFDALFQEILSKEERLANEIMQNKRPKPFQAGSKKSKKPAAPESLTTKDDAAEPPAIAAESPTNADAGGQSASPDMDETSPRQLSREEKEAIVRSKFKKVGAKSPTTNKETDAPKKPTKAPAASKKGDVYFADNLQQKLDHSEPQQNNSATHVIPESLIDKETLERIRMRKDPNFDIPDLSPASDAATDAAANEVNTAAQESESKPVGRLYSFFQGLTGQKVLTREDLETVMSKMKEHLIGKNVASEIADGLCESVTNSLIGKKMGSFTSIQSTVKDAMTPALQRILAPKRSTDILRDILEAKKQRRPYSMVFCGVNGVGKSTNLAKICFWLLQNKLKVLIAACDTFRSGAVEQLNTHVKNLRALDLEGDGSSSVSIQLFHRGYGKDAASIAKEALTYARSNEMDVVLIDTAGRMQDNAPLMQSLAKLVKINNPDRVLFVGEALVGNDGVDQLVKFDQALRDYSDPTDPRAVDGIVLTKFDTIDDKVGAALSMTYMTGQPIVFVGTGQTYTDLKKMNVDAVVQALLA